MIVSITACYLSPIPALPNPSKSTVQVLALTMQILVLQYGQLMILNIVDKNPCLYIQRFKRCLYGKPDYGYIIWCTLNVQQIAWNFFSGVKQMVGAVFLRYFF